MDSSGGEKIEVRNLTKRYGTTLAVDDLSFDVNPGVVTGFIGPNGSGKTTTMRLILGLDSPTSGQVTVGGKPIGTCRPPCARSARSSTPRRCIRAGPRTTIYWDSLRATPSHLLGSMRSSDSLGWRPSPEACRWILARHGPASRDRRSPARRSSGTDVRRAAQRFGPEGIVWIRQLMQHLAGRVARCSCRAIS